MIKKKLTSVALTGALALGGLGIGSMADLPIPGFSSEKAEAAVVSAVQYSSSTTWSNAANTLSVASVAFGDSPTMNDFLSKHTARFTIQNSSGTIVKTGSLNAWWLQDMGSAPMYAYEFENNTNISLAGLVKNGSSFRIKVSIPMDNGTITEAKFSSLTSAFTYNADGSVTNIRP